METITLESLKKDLTFTGDLMIDDTFLLLPSTAPVTDELIAALKEWEFATVYNDGALSLGGDIGVPTSSAEDEKPAEIADTAADASKVAMTVKKALEQTKQLGNGDESRMEMVQTIYDEYMNYIEKVYTFYATHKQINRDELAETVQELCIFIKENRRFILRANPSHITQGKNFLIRHSMRSTILAIVIALQLKMPLSKMIDLGVTCLIHEIGMLKLPPQLYMTEKKLTPGERSQILMHPLFGYQIVKDLEFPLSVQLGVLEHHEKENGTGYPRKLSGDKISINAKIISVACSYEAITAPRNYKDDKAGFDAMLEILKNANHFYDDIVIRALLYSVSLFPIGSYVYLSNRKCGLVIDTNQENPKYPVVQMLTEKEADGSPKVVQTSAEGIYIIRILSKQEQSDLIKIVEERYKSIKEAQAIAEENEQHPEQQAPKPEIKQEEIKKLDDSETEEIDPSFFGV